MLIGKTCLNSHHAFLGTTASKAAKPLATDFTCQFSFAEPTATGFPDPANKKKYAGYDLKYTSTQLKADKKTPE